MYGSGSLIFATEKKKVKLQLLKRNGISITKIREIINNRYPSCRDKAYDKQLFNKGLLLLYSLFFDEISILILLNNKVGIWFSNFIFHKIIFVFSHNLHVQNTFKCFLFENIYFYLILRWISKKHFNLTSKYLMSQKSQWSFWVRLVIEGEKKYI